MKSITIKNLAGLRAFAEKTAHSLKGGETIGLVGDLGAGKTTFTQALAAALGAGREVKSPTFTLMQVYDLPEDWPGRAPGLATLCHVDAYRLEDESEIYGIGIEDFLRDPHCVTVVEWADRVPSLHRWPGYRELTFRFGKGEERKIENGI
jgi:tRNA threonylcarbamoyladenosine biosynthesis protein TsaE